MRFRKVYQTTFKIRNNSCLPACISSLTGIPMREVHYQKCRQTNNMFPWITDFLSSKGFSIEWIQDIQNENYLKITEYTVNGRKTAHAVVTRGHNLLHDPAKFMMKKLNYKVNIPKYVMGKEYFFKLSRNKNDT